MAKSDYAENQVINYLLRTNTTYLALFTVAPGENSAGTEVAGNAYARQTMLATAWVAPGAPGSGTAGQTSNNTEVTFPAAAPGAWGTVVAFAVMDAAIGGNVLYYANLTASKTIDAGDQAKFAVGSLVVTES